MDGSITGIILLAARMENKYQKKSWTSLSQLKSQIEKDGKEKILSFDGISIVTKKHTYLLALGQLTVKENKK